MHVRRNTLKQWLPFIIWAALVFVVSSIPRLSVPDLGMPRWSDKVAHFIEYAVLAFLFYRGEGGQRWRMGIPAWLLVIVATLAIASLDEYHQRFIPGRDSSIMDWTADGAGIVVGTVIGMVRFGTFSRRAEKA
jgi:VanZ family protein